MDHGAIVGAHLRNRRQPIPAVRENEVPLFPSSLAFREEVHQLRYRLTSGARPEVHVERNDVSSFITDL